MKLLHGNYNTKKIKYHFEAEWRNYDPPIKKKNRKSTTNLKNQNKRSSGGR